MPIKRTELELLKKSLLHMGHAVEKSIDLAVQGLLKQEAHRFTLVFELEEEIDRAEKKHDEQCRRLLAKPGWDDEAIRQMLSFIKINTDLERMGDQAVNIAEQAQEYLGNPQAKVLVDIHTLARRVQEMVQHALLSLVQNDINLAQEVLAADDSIDLMKSGIAALLIQQMTRDAQLIPGSVLLIIIARNLERIADHATNIAEDVIFILTGEDVRHRGTQLSKGELDDTHTAHSHR